MTFVPKRLGLFVKLELAAQTVHRCWTNDQALLELLNFIEERHVTTSSLTSLGQPDDLCPPEFPHLIGLDSIGFDVHDAVPFNLPGGGVPCDSGRAVIHLRETKVPRWDQRY